MLIHDMRSPTNAVQYGLFSVSSQMNSLKTSMKEHSPFVIEMDTLNSLMDLDSVVAAQLDGLTEEVQ